MLAVPVYDVAILPATTIFFKYEQLHKLMNAEPRMGEQVCMVVQKERVPRSELDIKSFQPIGALARIIEVGEAGFAAVAIDTRVDVVSVSSIEGVFHAQTRPRPDVEDLSEKEAFASFERVRSALISFAQEYRMGPMARNYIMQFENIDELYAASSGWFSTSPADKYAMLECDSRAERQKLLEHAIFESLEMQRVSNEAQNAQENDLQSVYRESAIKKQLEFLQSKLDEMHPENADDPDRFRKLIDELNMNADARAEAEKVLARLKAEGKNGHEYAMLYDYLDFVTSLAWEAAPMEPIDLDAAQEILDEDHFGLAKVKKRILQHIAVMNLSKKQSGTILLFVGAPGTGKTSIGRSIARALGREYVRVSLGGVRDEADIRGHRRTYLGAMPGRIMDGIHKSGVANPVVVLDEVDKLSHDWAGDPTSALLEVLDPEQNFSFTDHYMNAPYDLSNVLFICTANTVDTIPGPLLDRMEVIQFSGYTPTEKFNIAREHLLPRALEACGLVEGDVVVSDDVLRSIIDDYTAEAGVRGLKKRLDTLCRVAAVEIVKARAGAGESDGDASNSPLEVPVDKLREYLDAKPIHHEHILAKKRPGVVCGLAWTAAGGEILLIETSFTKGSGKVTVTGQLGDVMKESTQIAVSVVKGLFPESAEMFEQNDLHIHVPAGAVPKDGPSAGITLSCALASLVTGRAVAPTVAMTGEVALRGVVMPIGGLPEKLMAAQRAGIERVFIPRENLDDLDDVAEEVRERLEIVAVDDVSDVLRETGIIEG